MDNNSRQYTAYPTSPLTNINCSSSQPQYYNPNQYNNSTVLVSPQPPSPTQQLTTARYYNSYTGGYQSQYQAPQVQRQVPVVNPVSSQTISRGISVYDNRKLLTPIREEYSVSKYIHFQYIFFHFLFVLMQTITIVSIIK